MDSNSLQHLPGMAYVQNLRQSLPSENPFSEYDDLTPDEPGKVWRLAKRGLGVLGEALASLHKPTREAHGAAARRPFAESR